MNPNKIITAEIVLLFASVLVFRSMWMILDSFSFMKEQFMLWMSLLAGTAVTAFVLCYLNRK